MRNRHTTAVPVYSIPVKMFLTDWFRSCLLYTSLIGMGNNPMVGATVAVAVSVQQASDEGKF